MADIVRFQVNIDDAALQNKVENLIDDETMLQIQNLFAKTIDPWVPFLEGPLSQTLDITPHYIHYKVPYAHYQYSHPEFNHTVEHHPLATAYWDQVAMQTQLDSFVAQVRLILERRAAQLYG